TFVGNVAGPRQNLPGGKFPGQFRPGGRQVLFTARTQGDIRPFGQEMFSDDLAESLAAARDERIKTFEFHIQARPTERCSTPGRFFNSFSKNRLASTKMRWRMAGVIFAQSAWRNSGHSVHTTTASAPVTASFIRAASWTAASSAGNTLTAGSKARTPAPAARRSRHNSTAALRRSVSVLVV